MITARDDYLELLYKVQNPNRQDTIIKLPKDEPIYHIDLNKRKIQAPEFLSVQYDHNSETIYFSVDRFFDNVDLSTVYCVIQYQNANPDNKKNGFIYAVPYFDITTLADENKILFQWSIEGPATAYSGIVEFSIKFYRITAVETEDIYGEVHSIKVYDYVLNTLPSKSKVLHGLNIYANSENYIYDENTVEAIYQRIEEVSRANDLYWIVLTDEPEMVQIEEDYPKGTINKNDQIYNNII